MSTPPPPPPKRRRYVSLVTRLGLAKAELDAAKERYDKLAELARADLPLGRHTDGTFEVLVTRNRAWDKARAFEDFGNSICSPAVDLKLARFVLTGEQFEAYYEEMEPRVIVREVGDEQP